MDEPWACVIRVWGALDPHWAARLRGLRITSTAGAGDDGEDGEALTELRGDLLDQATVLEVLHTLHALGVPLRSVTCTPRRRRRGRPPPGASGPAPAAGAAAAGAGAARVDSRPADRAPAAAEAGHDDEHSLEGAPGSISIRLGVISTFSCSATRDPPLSALG